MHDVLLLSNTYAITSSVKSTQSLSVGHLLFYFVMWAVSGLNLDTLGGALSLTCP